MSKATSARGNAVTTRERQPSWQVIALRVVAATLGGYAVTYWIGAALAVLLPLPASEAVYLVSLLQIFIFVAVVVWVFAESSVWRMLTIMGLTIGACAIPVLLHGGRHG